jgi:SAM-dependent methyltransferase
MNSADIVAHNREAWNLQVSRGNPWTVPVTGEEIGAARRGEWRIILTPNIPVPKSWYPPIVGCRVLCLASGGGQQGPILAAAGAVVTVFDNSPAQLDRDRQLSDRHGLGITTVQGDMADLSCFSDSSFDLIIHPVSNVFVPDVLPVWREAARVMRKGGVLLAGLNNPVLHIFDAEAAERGELMVTHKLPYSDLHDLPAEKRDELIRRQVALEFSHTLEDQIGGQCAAGLAVTGLYEDHDSPGSPNALDRYIPLYIATRAVRL